ncbi:Canalicular multispecific organic anion transporter 1 [Coemansia sp. RSA 989]|nr:Canalicular multispecific organic anion transporter 1 [Coemansia sp. RSA 989]
MVVALQSAKKLNENNLLAMCYQYGILKPNDQFIYNADEKLFLFRAMVRMIWKPIGLVASLRENIMSCVFLSQKMKITIDTYKNIERAFKGDFVKTLPREQVENIKAPKVYIKDGSFKWNNRWDQTVVVKNASFEITSGELVAVSGETGAGKSALLLALCGEMEMTQGSGKIIGQIGYLEQKPWIINDTLRANILFGRPFDQKLYQRVLYACAFNEDLMMWPEGDLTCIGDRGINISGGQRARLALARTLYSQADIYILDDPLSAVDAHVKRHIMEHVILDTGMLADKIRIIAANTDHITPFANQVIEMNDGCLSVRQNVPDTYRPIRLHPAMLGRRYAAYCKSIDNIDENANTNAQLNAASETSHYSLWSNAVYIVKLCTLPTCLVAMSIGVVQPVVSHIMDGYIINTMTLQGPTAQDSTSKLLRYLLLQMGSQTLLSLIAKISSCGEAIIQQKYIAQKLSQAFMHGVLYAPLSFFNSTTSHALQAAYQEGVSGLAGEMSQLLQSKIGIVARLWLTIWRITQNVPLLLIVVPVIWRISSQLQQFTQPAIHTLQELNNQASNMYCEINEVADSGSYLIRLNRVEAHFTKLFQDTRDKYEAVAWAYNSMLSTLSISSQVLTYVQELMVLLAVLAQRYVSGHKVGSGEYLQLTMLTQTLANNSKLLAEVPSDICSCLREVSQLRCIASVEPEAPYIVEKHRPAASWPAHGKIEFRQFSMRYRPDLDYALKNINLTIKPGEKIGIVGRTGAGKSSLVKSLFRLIPDGVQGTITIDGHDIAQIGVGDLRPRLGVIPQESTVLSGTFRENIDPLGKHTVEEIWAALLKCQAAKVVTEQHARSQKEHRNRYATWYRANWLKRLYMWATGNAPPADGICRSPLDMEVAGSMQLSSGQQQLLSLCRALIHKRQVVVLDEATADIDLKTDRYIQGVIQREFSSCTVLTIAHRLETVMHSDRIIVMDHGQIVEAGSPQELIKQNGFFAGLVRTNSF